MKCAIAIMILSGYHELPGKDMYCSTEKDLNMPKSNKNRKYMKSNDEDTIQKALDVIKAGLPKKIVAKMYSIPRATFQFRLSSKFKKTELGRNTYLTKNEEETLVQWILEGHGKGFLRRKLDVQQSTPTSVQILFKENLPCDHWYQLFLKRHKILTERTLEGVTATSANGSENNIRGWFKEIEDYFKEKGHMEVLNEASRVFNGDVFQLGKVITPVGTKNAYEVELEQAKQNLTVMFSFQVK
ncbi:hypothetical protein NQ318_023502 [Aromia moschata]|uniref:HTH CENPB-type domain-containing protein n=1 Tax=Aromia moschata TaxID=1265417 RepID=A0AAV8YPK2_9CUCU|nr:hypothetical protein NQ318_023502 [Aromia moschata]